MGPKRPSKHETGPTTGHGSALYRRGPDWRPARSSISRSARSPKPAHFTGRRQQFQLSGSSTREDWVAGVRLVRHDVIPACMQAQHDIYQGAGAVHGGGKPLSRLASESGPAVQGSYRAQHADVDADKTYYSSVATVDRLYSYPSEGLHHAPLPRITPPPGCVHPGSYGSVGVKPRMTPTLVGTFGPNHGTVNDYSRLLSDLRKRPQLA